MLAIDEYRCKLIAGQLKTLEIREEFYQREFLVCKASRESKLRLYLFSAAICHQTHSLFHPALNLWGWDYLEFGFLQMMKNKDLLFDESGFSSCTSENLKLALACVFSPDRNPKNTTFDRLDERANMLLEICSYLENKYNSSVCEFIDSLQGRLINEGAGFYEVLPRFEAFSDKLKKKITFFMKLAVDGKVLEIRDPENYMPIMDYHMQRVLLRMGCVNLDGSQWKEALRDKEQQVSDEPVRLACIEAILLIADESGHDILKMNDFFWPLGRSCCNTTTLCNDKLCIKSPCTFFSVVNVENHRACPFEDSCRGSRDDSYRSLWEPIVETHYY